jgi:fructose-bisphosphate aldolase, class II
MEKHPMSIVSFNSLLSIACQQSQAVGCFEIWDLYSLEGVLAAAEELNAPVIIGIGSLSVNRRWLDEGGVANLGTLARKAAERAGAQVSLLLNEAHSMGQVKAALDAGYNAIFFASWDLPYEENVAVTCEVVEAAHTAGAAVEGELSASQAVDGLSCTDPGLAANFVQHTGVDALAVSVGNARYRATANGLLRLEALMALHAAVSIPLVIHGGSGMSPADIQTAARHGVAKFNVGTALKQAFYFGLMEAAAAAPSPQASAAHMGRRDELDIFLAGQQKLQHRVQEFMKLFRGNQAG